jgi:solute carrier family 25 (mitochondrial 2-oxodicarboxylate transporter), member 21
MTEVTAISPAEVVKVRMQAKNRTSVYANTWDAFAKMYRSEGLLAFFQGLETALWRQALWNGSYFGVTFWMRQSVLPKGESKSQEMMYSFLAGAAGGAVGTTLNTPFDVVVSRMRNVLPGEASPYRWSWQSVALIAREEGVQSLYRGYLPKLLRLGPGGGIMLVVYDMVISFLRGD